MDRFMEINNEKDSPFVHGFISNLRMAFKRYSYIEIFRRLGFMIKQPGLLFDYLQMLNTKKAINDGVIRRIPIKGLRPQHRVTINHDHHKERVSTFLSGKPLKSSSPIIVVDDLIFDGHHRIAAMMDAGYEGEVECLYFGLKPEKS